MSVIYVDSLFALNLILNYLLLLFTVQLSALPLKRLRLCAGAAIGAFYAVATVLPGLEWTSSVWLKIAITIPLTAVAFGFGAGYFRGLLLFWVSSFLLAGVVLGISLLFQTKLSNGLPYIHISVKTLLLVSAVTYFVLSILLKGIARYGGTKNTIVTICVSLRGKSVEFKALVDTGHALTDPVTGHRVVIAELLSLAPLLSKDIRGLLNSTSLLKPLDLMEQVRMIDSSLMLRLIPYQAIGIEKGWLLAFRPDSISIDKKEYDKLLVAFSPNRISTNKPYAALVGV